MAGCFGYAQTVRVCSIGGDTVPSGFGYTSTSQYVCGSQIIANNAQVGKGTLPRGVRFALLSDTAGLMLPKGTTTQMNALSTNNSFGAGHKGTQFYNTTTNEVNTWNGSAWTVPVGTTYTFANGLTESGGTVKLGGSLNSGTTVSGIGYTFKQPSSYATFINGFDTVFGFSLPTVGFYKSISPTLNAVIGMRNTAAFGQDSINITIGYEDLTGTPSTRLYLNPITGNALLQATGNISFESAAIVDVEAARRIDLTSDTTRVFTSDYSLISQGGGYEQYAQNFTTISSETIFSESKKYANATSYDGFIGRIGSNPTGAQKTATINLQDSLTGKEMGFAAIYDTTSKEGYSNIYIGYTDAFGNFVDLARIEGRYFQNEPNRDFIRMSQFCDSSNANHSGAYYGKDVIQLEVNTPNYNTGDTAVGTFLRLDTTNGVQVIKNGQLLSQINAQGVVTANSYRIATGGDTLGIIYNADSGRYDINSNLPISINNAITFNPADSTYIGNNCATGWASYVDGLYTSASPLVFTATNWTTLVNHCGTILTPQMPCDMDSMYSRADTGIIGLVGDAYSVNIEFKARPNTPNTTYIDVAIDIDGAVGLVYPRTYTLAKGNNVEQFVSISTSVYTLDTWAANTGKIKLKTSDSVDIYDYRLVIHRLHKAR